MLDDSLISCLPPEVIPIPGSYLLQDSETHCCHALTWHTQALFMDVQQISLRGFLSEPVSLVLRIVWCYWIEHWDGIPEILWWKFDHVCLSCSFPSPTLHGAPKWQWFEAPKRLGFGVPSLQVKSQLRCFVRSDWARVHTKTLQIVHIIFSAKFAMFVLGIATRIPGFDPHPCMVVS